MKERSLSELISEKLGYSPVGADWVERLQRVQGRFRRSRYENGLRIFGAVAPPALVVMVIVTEIRRGAWLVDIVHDPLYLTVTIVMAWLVAFLLWPLGRTYVFENGELRYLSRRGRVLWREELRGLKYVTCSSGGGRTMMTLRWPERSRRIELFDSLRSSLDNQLHA